MPLQSDGFKGDGDNAGTTQLKDLQVSETAQVPFILSGPQSGMLDNSVKIGFVN